MFNRESMFYGLDDVTIIPSASSGVTHRSMCDVRTTADTLPIFCAPMDSVCNTTNYIYYRDNGIIPMLPRTIPFGERIHFASQFGVWIAVGLQEFELYFVDESYMRPHDYTYKVCIDIANGHLSKLFTLITLAKNRARTHGYKLVIMAGNVANRDTYAKLSDAGADYVRVGIGGGACCLTSSNTGVHTPMASLIADCRATKDAYNLSACIVADGGINTWARAIKALALGADYVMMGTMLAKCFESASPIQCCTSTQGKDPTKFDEKTKRDCIANDIILKTMHGMSTPEAQRAIDPNAAVRPTEGLSCTIRAEYTVQQFTELFEAYLRSAMSYCDAYTLQQFYRQANVATLAGNITDYHNSPYAR